MSFEEFKKEIAGRCKAQSACSKEYGRLLASSNFAELFTVLKDNINWVFNNNILDAEVLLPVITEANFSNIWVNVDASSGYLFASGSASVKAWGSASVKAWGSASVKAWDSASVKASGSASVEAWDSASVKAWDSASVKASGSASVKAWDSASVEASGSASVEASGSAFVSSHYSIECKISEKAIYRNISAGSLTMLENTYVIINPNN